MLEYLILMENPTKNPIAGPTEIFNGNIDGKSGNDFILALSLKKDTTKFSLVYVALNMKFYYDPQILERKVFWFSKKGHHQILCSVYDFWV